MTKKSEQRNLDIAKSFIETDLKIKTKQIPESELSKHQVVSNITPSENTFKVALYRSLRSKHSFYISHQDFIFTSGAATKKKLLKSSDHHLLEKLTPLQVYRPDFVIHQHGIIIEVDGLIHDNDSTKEKKDALRDYALFGAGYKVFRIENRQVHRLKDRQRFINDINQYIAEIENDPNFQKKYQARRTNQSKLRKKQHLLPASLRNKPLKNAKTATKKKQNYPAHEDQFNTFVQYGAYKTKITTR